MANSKPSKILITGATGFVGHRAAEMLLEKGYPVRLLVRNIKRLDPHLAEQCEVITGDLLNPSTLETAVTGVELIFHCAANVSTWDNWDAYYQANVLGVKNILDATVKKNPELKRLLHLSTVDVYGFPDYPCDENAPLAGENFHYGKSKLMGEELVIAYGKEHKIPYTILRPCNIIGPRSQFIQRIGKELQRGLMLTIDRGRLNAGILYVDTLVEYMLSAATATQASQEIYNIRSNYDITWEDFITQFKRSIKGRGIVINLPFGAADSLAKVFEIIYKLLKTKKEPLLHRLIVRMFGKTCGHSAIKIQSHLGIHQEPTFREIIKSSSSWYLKNKI